MVPLVNQNNSYNVVSDSKSKSDDNEIEGKNDNIDMKLKLPPRPLSMLKWCKQ